MLNFHCSLYGHLLTEDNRGKISFLQNHFDRGQAESNYLFTGKCRKSIAYMTHTYKNKYLTTLWGLWKELWCDILFTTFQTAGTWDYSNCMLQNTQMETMRVTIIVGYAMEAVKTHANDIFTFIYNILNPGRTGLTEMTQLSHLYLPNSRDAYASKHWSL